MTELHEVVLTAPDPGWLTDLSRKLIEQPLCASAHNSAPVRSIYRWRGEIYERTEGRVSLHTRRDRVAEIHLTWTLPHCAAYGLRRAGPAGRDEDPNDFVRENWALAQTRWR